jgi:polyhydroxyalkanoate synthesis regulator phasin
MDYVMVAVLFSGIGFVAGLLVYRNNVKKLNGVVEMLERELMELKNKLK